LPEVQADHTTWVAPGGPLGELVLAAARRGSALASVARDLERAALAAPAAPSFASSLQRADVAVIAELKRRSPSKGAINELLDAPARAAEYAAGGAAAISVLTEPARFGGSLDDLRAARRATAVPILRKDFIVDRLQLFEAREAGASAVLLIARALPPSRFASLAASALAIGLGVLLEVRSESELEQALRIDGAVIGVNNRNLETLELGHAVTERLVPLVPRDRIVVYESGVASVTDVERAAALGADAVLIGSTLSAPRDGAAAVAAFVGVPRHPRAR
jgi:indole-3-glycerol phosphate synthase